MTILLLFICAFFYCSALVWFTRKHWKIFNLPDKVNYVIAVIALTGLLITLVNSINNTLLTKEKLDFEKSQQERISHLENQLNSITYQPRLIVIGNLNIDTLSSDTAVIEIEQINTASEPGNAPITEIPIKLSIKASLKFTNIGPSLGRLLTVVTTDTIPSIDYLRAYLTGKIHNSSINWRTNYFPEFINSDILPDGNDTLALKTNYSVTRIRNQKFVLHTLILYENELGFIYDTYFQTSYKIRELLIPIPDSIETPEGKMKPRYVRIAINDIRFAIQDQSQSLYHSYYEKEDIKNIHRILDSLKILHESNNP